MCLFRWLIIQLRAEKFISTLQFPISIFLLLSMSRSMEQWVVHGKHNRRCLFFYQQKVLDLTEFIPLHPGGKKALANYINKDITEILFKVYPHKKEHTLKILNRYAIGAIRDKTPLKKNIKNLNKRTDPPKQKKRVCFHKKFVCEDENDDRSDDSQNIQMKRQASKKKSLHSKNKNTPEEKDKKSREKRSLKSITDKRFEQDQKFQSLKPVKKKTKKLKDRILNSNIIQSELDEQKPLFKVPILTVKHMNQLWTG